MVKEEMKNLKDKKEISSMSFSLLKRKIFCYGIIFIFSGFLFFYEMVFLFKNHFSALLQEGLQFSFHLNTVEAVALYEHIFRNYRDLWIVLLFLLIFLSSLWLYCHWITQYIQKINASLDGLLQPTLISPPLSEELRPIEKKIEDLKFHLENQKTEIQLHQQKKNDLIMYLAHDLKTPLASALGYLTLLKDEKEIRPDLQQRYLTIVLNKVNHLEEMIEEFLEISKYSLSTLSLTYSTIDLPLLIEQVLFELQSLLNSKNLSYSLSFPSPILLSCDPDKLQRVFNNILHNAILYSDPHTTIEIKGRVDGKKVILSFSNSGPTIPIEKLALIFEQFYRLDSARNSNGSGLGLAIAKQIVLLHQGEIKVTSRDKITTFTIALPLSSDKIENS